MKLMEEIIEFDQEIKMKQKWINSRISLLHQIQGKQDKTEDMKMIIHNFLQQIQPEYPRKLSVEYNRTGSKEAIPLKMADRYAQKIPMGMSDKYPGLIPMPDSPGKQALINFAASPDSPVQDDPKIEEVDPDKKE